ncbi:MAG: 6-pyruvoyl tetrahydropterin synthase family protein [Pirellulaceae bacterium]|nr:6-pyruvoyl tetrahydropterin synthase family protein [Pirellulaceae bacterium]
MSETFHLKLSKKDLVFSAAHFITFCGNVCERLHGHNYGVEVELSGTLDENYYLVDFIALRGYLDKIVTSLDHYMLLPTQHPKILVHKKEDEVEVTFEEKRWLFPADNCRLLPIENTTAELLASYVGNELWNAFSINERKALTRCSVGIDENNGQWGFWEKKPSLQDTPTS